jgi:hypothetical protein
LKKEQVLCVRPSISNYSDVSCLWLTDLQEYFRLWLIPFKDSPIFH